MRWKTIEGYKYQYRVSDTGIIQKHDGKRWVQLEMLKDGRSAKVLLRTTDGNRIRKSVGRIVWEKFVGPIPPGKVVQVKNGFRRDCAVENLQLTTLATISHKRRNPMSKPVMKMDRAGNVVAFYASASEAAKDNYCSVSAMRYHCAGLVADKFRMDGYEYRYEDRRKRKGDSNATQEECGYPED